MYIPTNLLTTYFAFVVVLPLVPKSKQSVRKTTLQRKPARPRVLTYSCGSLWHADFLGYSTGLVALSFKTTKKSYKLKVELNNFVTNSFSNRILIASKRLDVASTKFAQLFKISAKASKNVMINKLTIAPFIL